ncbi:hypothetical protein HK096_001519 [Nowakowskiella sp. JEL0078]|nr:hypothetical protein HK096_001519 [Nowakowskiella sp. JEL0078]
MQNQRDIRDSWNNREFHRKHAHRTIERRRRERINDKIDQLKLLIPSCVGQKRVQKVETLQYAIEHIIESQRVLAELQKEYYTKNIQTSTPLLNDLSKSNFCEHQSHQQQCHEFSNSDYQQNLNSNNLPTKPLNTFSGHQHVCQAPTQTQPRSHLPVSQSISIHPHLSIVHKQTLYTKSQMNYNTENRSIVMNQSNQDRHHVATNSNLHGNLHNTLISKTIPPNLSIQDQGRISSAGCDCHNLDRNSFSAKNHRENYGDQRYILEPKRLPSFGDLLKT